MSYTFDDLKDLDWKYYNRECWGTHIPTDIDGNGGFGLKLKEKKLFWIKMYDLYITGKGSLDIDNKEAKRLYNFLMAQEQVKQLEEERRKTREKERALRETKDAIAKQIKRSKGNE